MTTTLRVEAVKTETTPGEFVTDAYRVAVNGETVYQSRFALKALVKAAVLVNDDRFPEAVLDIEGETATQAGKDNLKMRLDAERFWAIRELSNVEPPVDEIVQGIQVSGNNVATPEQD